MQCFQNRRVRKSVDLSFPQERDEDRHSGHRAVLPRSPLICPELLLHCSFLCSCFWAQVFKYGAFPLTVCAVRSGKVRGISMATANRYSPYPFASLLLPLPPKL